MRAFLCVFAVSGLFAAAACGQEEATQPAPATQVAAGKSAAAAENAAASIRARQTHYKQIGKSMKAIGDELKASEPSLQEIRMNAAQIAEFAPQVLSWFPAGSGAEAGLETRAKQEIWADPQGFARAAQRFILMSEQFHDVTQTGDLTAIRAAQERLGASCKSCHDDFRAPEE